MFSFTKKPRNIQDSKPQSSSDAATGLEHPQLPTPQGIETMKSTCQIIAHLFEPLSKPPNAIPAGLNGLGTKASKRPSQGNSPGDNLQGQHLRRLSAATVSSTCSTAMQSRNSLVESDGSVGIFTAPPIPFGRPKSMQVMYNHPLAKINECRGYEHKVTSSDDLSDTCRSQPPQDTMNHRFLVTSNFVDMSSEDESLTLGSPTITNLIRSNTQKYGVSDSDEDNNAIWDHWEPWWSHGVKDGDEFRHLEDIGREDYQTENCAESNSDTTMEVDEETDEMPESLIEPDFNYIVGSWGAAYDKQAQVRVCYNKRSRPEEPELALSVAGLASSPLRPSDLFSERSPSSPALNNCQLSQPVIPPANLSPVACAASDNSCNFSSFTSLLRNFYSDPYSFEETINHLAPYAWSSMTSMSDPPKVPQNQSPSIHSSQPSTPTQSPLQENLEVLLEQAFQIISAPSSCPNSPCTHHHLRRTSSPLTTISDMTIHSPTLHTRPYRLPRSPSRQRSQTSYSGPPSPSQEFAVSPITASEAISIPKGPRIPTPQNTPPQSSLLDWITSVGSSPILAKSTSVAATTSRPSRTALATSTIAALLNAAAAAAVSNTALTKSMMGGFGSEAVSYNLNLQTQNQNDSVSSDKSSSESEEDGKVLYKEAISDTERSEFANMLDQFSIDPSLVISAAASAAKASAAIFMSGTSWSVNTGVPNHSLSMYRQQHRALRDLHKVLSDVTSMLNKSSLALKCDATTNTDEPMLVEDEVQTDEGPLKVIYEDTVVDAIPVLNPMETMICSDNVKISNEVFENMEVVEETIVYVEDEVIEEIFVIDELIEDPTTETENKIIHSPLCDHVNKFEELFIPSVVPQEILTEMITFTSSPSRQRKSAKAFADSLDLRVLTSNSSTFNSPTTIEVNINPNDSDEEYVTPKSILRNSTLACRTPRKSVRFSDNDFEQVLAFDKVTSPLTIRDTDIMTFKDTHEDNHKPPSNILTSINFTIPPASPTSSFSSLTFSHPVRLETLSLEGRTVVGTVVVKNLAFHKRVIVRYTSNHWVDFAEAEAKYKTSINTVTVMGSEPSLDRFGFYLDCGSVFEQIMGGPCLCDGSAALTKLLEFVIRYEVGGDVVWENNGGENYMVELGRRVPKTTAVEKVPEKILKVAENFTTRSVNLRRPMFGCGLTEPLVDEIFDDDDDVGSATAAGADPSFKYNGRYDFRNSIGRASSGDALSVLANQSRQFVDRNQRRNSMPNQPFGIVPAVGGHRTLYAQDCEGYVALAAPKTPAFANGVDVNREDERIRELQRQFAQMN
ncbi:hypothetical protein HK096_006671 [Nowakowskiella sp. JEL0078]|nr:hypothetical protein HK096_006671 [Nowakowskiella sp. JEL0078]